MTEHLEVLSRSGWTAVVYLIPPPSPTEGPQRVIKVFNYDCVETHFPSEKAAYERFSANDHPASILKYYGTHETIPASIIMELAPNGSLHDYMWKQKQQNRPDPSPTTLYRWASQAAEGLAFAHSLGVCNSDIHPVNLFLDADLNLKVGDWAGASIDGSKTYSSYRLRYRLFRTNGTDVSRAHGISPVTEIYALGTAMYVLVTGHEPWPELHEVRDRYVIVQRLLAGMLPDTSTLRALGGVIHKCWTEQFDSMLDVKAAVDAEKDANAFAGPAGV